MRRGVAGDSDDEFWPAYTDILMVTCLILILLLVSFVISRTDNHIREEQDRRKRQFATEFNHDLADEVARHQVSLISPKGERQVISFSDQLLFDVGDAALTKPAGLASLAKLSILIKRHLVGEALFNSVKVNGHTDEDPIVTVEFPSNWHLSGARATSVVYFLVKHGIPPQELSATGYAEFQPVDAAGHLITDKARKRRIDIELLYPEDWIARQETKHHSLNSSSK
jgi:flagellar motor protein MotB